MAKCPDCYSTSDLVGLFGDGKCSVCHGSGKNPSVLDEMAEGLTGVETECYNCVGSGECPTCRGSGEV